MASSVLSITHPSLALRVTLALLAIVPVCITGIYIFPVVRSIVSSGAVVSRAICKRSSICNYISIYRDFFSSSSLPLLFYIIIITSTITMTIAYKYPTPLRRIFYFFRALFCYPPRHSLVSAPSAQSSRLHPRISIRLSCFYSHLYQGLPLLFALAIAILIPSPSTGVFFSEFAPILLGHASGQLQFSVAECSLPRFYSWFHGRALIPANCRPN